jgi:hypothetical protein
LEVPEFGKNWEKVFWDAAGFESRTAAPVNGPRNHYFAFWPHVSGCSFFCASGIFSKPKV